MSAQNKREPTKHKNVGIQQLSGKITTAIKKGNERFWSKTKTYPGKISDDTKHMMKLR